MLILPDIGLGCEVPHICDHGVRDCQGAIPFTVGAYTALKVGHTGGGAGRSATSYEYDAAVRAGPWTVMALRTLEFNHVV